MTAYQNSLINQRLQFILTSLLLGQEGEGNFVFLVTC